ncbi:MAG: MBL fold metallo-hydrolase [Planctomycetaceae bacterium]|nr:MBL fold metallo-hydrolase [Planctomycetaceae bacterium]
MEIAISFLGAAQNVTGSRHLLEMDGRKILVDCGLYQERRFQDRNWDRFPIAPDKLDAVLLTHAHLDHCGLLPKLVKEGFRGRIFCTAATAQIAQIILLDSAHIQEEDAAFKQKRHKKQDRVSPHGYQPLYTIEDAQKCEAMFAPVGYNTPVEVAKGITAVFHEAGHVFGSSTISVNAKADALDRTILFSGDVGRWNNPIIADPDLVPKADYALVESTYGDRVHEAEADINDRLADVITRTVKAGGKLIIPSFALERSQELLYRLNELHDAKRIPSLPVFLDSPMAIRITRVMKEHPECFNLDMAEQMRDHGTPLDFPGLAMTETTEQSKAINAVRGPCIIIAGSGMCTGGRIKHHLAQNISNPRSTILFVGYQAVDTLGRIIVDGAGKVRILGQEYQVKASVARINGFSAHADRDELLCWLSGLAKPPRQIFVVHGEAQTAVKFAEFIHQKTGWPATAPNYQDRVVLS